MSAYERVRAMMIRRVAHEANILPAPDGGFVVSVRYGHGSLSETGETENDARDALVKALMADQESEVEIQKFELTDLHARAGDPV